MRAPYHSSHHVCQAGLAYTKYLDFILRIAPQALVPSQFTPELTTSKELCASSLVIRLLSRSLGTPVAMELEVLSPLLGRTCYFNIWKSKLQHLFHQFQVPLSGVLVKQWQQSTELCQPGEKLF